MALLKLGGVVTAISGKVGGQIFGTSINGSYLKSNSYSQQHASQWQGYRRSLLYQTSQMWRTLSQAQKNLWIAEVVNYPYINRVGDTVNYTGYQLFNLANQNRLIVGASQILVPGLFAAQSVMDIDPILVKADTIRVNYSGQTNTDYTVYYASRATIGSIHLQPSKLILLGAIAVDGGSGQDNLYSLYIQKFTFPVLGQWIYIMAKGVRLVSGIPTLFTKVYGIERTE